MESTKERRIGSKFDRYYDKLNMFRNTVLLFRLGLPGALFPIPPFHEPRDIRPPVSPTIEGRRWVVGPPPSWPSNSKLQDIEAYIAGETSQHKSDKTNLHLSDHLFTTRYHN